MSSVSGANSLVADCVLSLDARNVNSYPMLYGRTNHCNADWYCFVTSTATYALPIENTTVYQRTNLGDVSVIVSPLTTPQRGTFTAYAGYTYYASAPMFLIAEDNQHAIAPVTMSSTLFIYFAYRVGSELGTIYIYSPNAAGTVNVYKDGAGINGTVYATTAVSAGGMSTIALTLTGTYYITSTVPVVVTTTQITADKTILSPATNIVYYRYANYVVNSINGVTPTSNNCVSYDINYPIMQQNIADGAGSDTTQALGLEYLSKNYTFGNVMSDYVIVAPYAGTVVGVYYWNTTRWTLLESHVMEGSIYFPAQIIRDGTLGVGVAGTTISGLATNFATGATLWKWVSNNPVYVCINDSQDDEFSMLGWDDVSVNKIQNKNMNLTDLSTNKFTSYLYNGATQKQINSGYIVFDGVDDYSDTTLTGINIDGGCTIECVLKQTALSAAWRNFITIKNAALTTFFDLRTGGTSADVQAGYYNGTNYYTTTYPIDLVNFFHVVCVYNGAGTITLYINGVLKQTVTSVPAFAIGTNPIVTIGRAYSNDRPNFMNLALCKIHKKALTGTEIQINFDSIRGSYNI